MSSSSPYVPLATLESGLDPIRQSPATEGVLELIVRRSGVGEREVIEAGQLDLIEGLVGDTWTRRGRSQANTGSLHLETQLTIMNARVIALLAQDKSRWSLAGDQLFVDLDLSQSNVPAGTRLSLGSAVIEVTREPHTGCQKFAERFGRDAVRFVNSSLGKELHLRGIHAMVVRPGAIRTGDMVRKVR